MVHKNSPKTTRVADIDSLTISDVQRALAEGSFSSESLIAAYIERSQSRPDLNIFITLDTEGALAAARAVDAARAAGQQLGPLAGVPIVVKDNIHVAGLPSTAGTRALADFIPTEDAPVVRKLREAGAIILGKTNMHELAFGATGYNAAYHVPDVVGVRNPYDATRIAGGSSSGSAAALGARMAAASLGTDTGGSMRIPPALNGCAALRPSPNRYPDKGIAPISSSRDVPGPMALCMADVALLDGLITGEQTLPPVELKSLRLGVVADFWANMDEEVAAIAAEVQKKLESAGVQFVEVDDTEIMSLNNAVGFPVVFHEARPDMESYLATQGPGISIEELREGIVSPDVAAIYDNFVLPRKAMDTEGKIVDSAPLYEMAQKVGRPKLRERYRMLFAQYKLDALIFPATPVIAPLAKPDVSEPQNFALLIQNTEPAASAGLPGIALPVGLGASTGLPVGFELDGHAGEDRRLLAIGIALETVLGRIPAAQL